MTRIVLALAVLFSVAAVSIITVATPSLAQSQPNYGPAKNGGGDTFGEPYSGSAGARRRSGGY